MTSQASPALTDRAPADPSAAPAARIYRPTRSTMQAGAANSKAWVLEFEPSHRPEIEPLMGWTSSRDTRRQVRLNFSTKEHAIAFARRQGWRFTVAEPKAARLRPKSYADNFRDSAEG